MVWVAVREAARAPAVGVTEVVVAVGRAVPAARAARVVARVAEASKVVARVAEASKVALAEEVADRVVVVAKAPAIRPLAERAGQERS